MLTGIASATWSYAPGQEVDLPTETATAWIKSGIAAAVVAPVETATAQPPENAAMPAPQRRKAGR